MAFMPIGDEENPTLVRPVATYLLITVNVLVYFFLQPGLNGGPDGLAAGVQRFYDTWALVPAEIRQGRDLHTLLSSLFLHGGLLHLWGNLLYLWIFGDNVEDAFGRVGYLLFYVVCGAAASLLQVFLFPSSQVWNIGASGAIAGILGAYLVLYPHARINVMVWSGAITRLRASVVIGLWFVLQLLSGGSQLTATADAGGVAYWAHVGGFLAGVALAPIGVALLGRRDTSRGT
jgi:membrane associated rhomboid family serine protease